MTEQRFKQGYYHPKHPEKYIGDVNHIVYRSSWELKFNQFLDNNPNVLQWGSEIVVIPYVKPTDGKMHKYYVDYFIKYRDVHGNEQTELIEIKPKSQVNQPSKRRNQQLYEAITFAINQSKWAAATKFAESRGWKFRIITEQELFR